MANESEKVEIKLVVDDKAAQQTLQNVKSGADSAASGGQNLSTSMAVAGLKIEAVKAIASAAWHAVVGFSRQLTTDAIVAAEAANKQEKQMAGLIMMMSGGQRSMRSARGEAAVLGESFSNIALSAHTSKDKVVDAFNSMMQGGQLSSKQAARLAEQMATVGKVVPGGIDALSEGFRNLELGIARPRNAMVQLIAATGTLKGNAHEVAAAMMKMTPEKMLDLAAQAVEKQGSAMKGGPLQRVTRAQLDTTMDTTKDRFLESMGKPMLDKLEPQLAKIDAFLLKHVDAISEFGDEIGHALGQGISVVGDAVGVVYDVLSKNWSDIAAFGKAAAAPFIAAWQFAVSHKEDIITGIKVAAEALVGAFKLAVWAGEAFYNAAVKPFIEAGKFVAKIMGKAIDEAPKIAGMAASALPGGLGNEFNRGQANLAAGRASKAAVGGDSAEFEKALSAYRDFAFMAGVSGDEITQRTASLQAQRDAESASLSMVQEAVAMGDYQTFAKYVLDSSGRVNVAHAEAAAAMVNGSANLQQALVMGGVLTAPAFDEFMQVIDDKSHQLAKKLKDASNAVGSNDKTEARKTAAAGGGGGGITINIKQDFRDQDPDRIAMIFRRDVMKALQTPMQARTSMGGV